VLRQEIHLVPFGEYLPFQDFLEKLGLMQLTKLPAALSPASGAAPCSAPRAADCCRSSATRSSSRRNQCRTTNGGLALNLTNDGWFGISSGPYQHLQQARVRTIEQDCRWCARRTPNLRGESIRSAASSNRCRLAQRASWTRSLPRRIDATLYARTGDAGVSAGHRCCLIIIIRRRGETAVIFIITGVCAQPQARYVQVNAEISQSSRYHSAPEFAHKFAQHSFAT